MSLACNWKHRYNCYIRHVVVIAGNWKVRSWDCVILVKHFMTVGPLVWMLKYSHAHNKNLSVNNLL